MVLNVHCTMFLYNILNFSSIHIRILPFESNSNEIKTLPIGIQNSSGNGNHQKVVKRTRAASTSYMHVLKREYNG